MDYTKKLIKKETMQKVLKSLIGVSTKTLPAELKFGDIVIYDEELFQYKLKEPSRVEIVSDDKFDKIGLRFERNYTEDVFTDYTQLYDWLVAKRDFTRAYYEMRNNYYYTNGSSEYPIVDKNTYSVRISDYVNFNSDDNNKLMTIEELTEKYPNIVSEKELMEYNKKGENFLNSITVKDFLIENELLRKLNTAGLTHQGYMYSDPSAWHNDICIVLERPAMYNADKNDSYVLMEKSQNDYFTSGIYQKEPSKKVDNNHELKPNEHKITFKNVTESDNSSYNGLYINVSIGSKKNVQYHDRFCDFWKPKNQDAYDRTWGVYASALDLNKRQNFGYYVECLESGKYEVECKICYTNIDQCEDNQGLGWLAMYPQSKFYGGIYERKTDSWWYQEWDRQNIKNAYISFAVTEDKTIENVSFYTDEYTQKGYTDHGSAQHDGKEFMEKNFIHEIYKNTLFFQAVYATYSYDDNGGWNAWAYAHIIPPFTIKYKGL